MKGWNVSLTEDWNAWSNLGNMAETKRQETEEQKIMAERKQRGVGMSTVKHATNHTKK